MIVEITQENINELDNSFINKEEVIHEFEINPFAKYLIYKDEKLDIDYDRNNYFVKKAQIILRRKGDSNVCR